MTENETRSPAAFDSRALELRERELDLKERELALKQSEFEFQQRNENTRTGSGKGLSNSPGVSASIIVGIVGALVAMFGYWYQGRVNTDLERKKFESALILKAVEPEDSEVKKRNLLFFLEAGLIGDSDNKIQHLTTTPAKLPEIAKEQSASTNSGVWIVVIETDKTLVDAQTHAEAAKAAGFTDLIIYKRNGLFRTVIRFSSMQEAYANISRIQSKINATAYPVNPQTWCLGPVPGTEYVECKGE